MSNRVVVLCALQNELKEAKAPDGVELLFTGVGKVNTASVTTEVILAAKPTLIVNYGTAGKVTSSLRGLVEVAHVIQRDMNAEPLAPRGKTPLMPPPYTFSSGFGEVTCGTGDSFVTATDPWLIDNKIDVVDMELFAMAAVCARFGVPWRAFKFITDDANDFAAEHWTDNVSNGEQLFWNAMAAHVLGRS